MAAIRFPTAAELEQGSATYEAEMQMRTRHPVPYPRRDADPVEPEGPAPAIFPPHPLPEVVCAHCGLVFDHYGTKGMRVLQLRKHEKKMHAELAEAY